MKKSLMTNYVGWLLKYGYHCYIIFFLIFILQVFRKIILYNNIRYYLASNIVIILVETSMTLFAVYCTYISLNKQFKIDTNSIKISKYINVIYTCIPVILLPYIIYKIERRYNTRIEYGYLEIIIHQKTPFHIINYIISALKQFLLIYIPIKMILNKDIKSIIVNTRNKNTNIIDILSTVLIIHLSYIYLYQQMHIYRNLLITLYNSLLKATTWSFIMTFIVYSLFYKYISYKGNKKEDSK